MTTKPFTLRTILTVTTGRLLTKSRGPNDNGIGDLYELLEWMTGEPPFTHQLGRFAAECKPWLLRWFPQLESCGESLEKIDTNDLESWLSGLAKYGYEDAYDVPKIPRDDHTSKDPVAELREMMGGKPVIVATRKGPQS